MPRFAAIAVVGLAAGFLSGLFGIGGGLVMVPAMVLILGVRQHRAHATSMAAIVLVATAAMIPFAVGSEVDWSKVGWIAIGSLGGAAIGAWGIGRVSEVWLARSFVLLAVVAAIRLGVGQ